LSVFIVTTLIVTHHLKFGFRFGEISFLPLQLNNQRLLFCEPPLPFGPIIFELPQLIINRCLIHQNALYRAVSDCITKNTVARAFGSTWPTSQRSPAFFLIHPLVPWRPIRTSSHRRPAPKLLRPCFSLPPHLDIGPSSDVAEAQPSRGHRQGCQSSSLERGERASIRSGRNPQPARSAPPR